MVKSPFFKPALSPDDVKSAHKLNGFFHGSQLLAQDATSPAPASASGSGPSNSLYRGESLDPHGTPPPTRTPVSVGHAPKTSSRLRKSSAEPIKASASTSPLANALMTAIAKASQRLDQQRSPPPPLKVASATERLAAARQHMDRTSKRADKDKRQNGGDAASPKPRKRVDTAALVERLTQHTTLAWENKIDDVPDIDGARMNVNMGAGGANNVAAIVRDSAAYMYHTPARQRHASRSRSRHPGSRDSSPHSRSHSRARSSSRARSGSRARSESRVRSLSRARAHSTGRSASRTRGYTTHPEGQRNAAAWAPEGGVDDGPLPSFEHTYLGERTAEQRGTHRRERSASKIRFVGIPPPASAGKPPTPSHLAADPRSGASLRRLAFLTKAGPDELAETFKSASSLNRNDSDPAALQPADADADRGMRGRSRTRKKAGKEPGAPETAGAEDGDEADGEAANTDAGEGGEAGQGSAWMLASDMEADEAVYGGDLGAIRQAPLPGEEGPSRPLHRSVSVSSSRYSNTEGAARRRSRRDSGTAGSRRQASKALQEAMAEMDVEDVKAGIRASVAPTSTPPRPAQTPEVASPSKEDRAAEAARREAAFRKLYEGSSPHLKPREMTPEEKGLSEQQRKAMTGWMAKRTPSSVGQFRVQTVGVDAYDPVFKQASTTPQLSSKKSQREIEGIASRLYGSSTRKFDLYRLKVAEEAAEREEVKRRPATAPRQRRGDADGLSPASPGAQGRPRSAGRGAGEAGTRGAWLRSFNQNPSGAWMPGGPSGGPSRGPGWDPMPKVLDEGDLAPEASLDRITSPEKIRATRTPRKVSAAPGLWDRLFKDSQRRERIREQLEQERRVELEQAELAELRPVPLSPGTLQILRENPGLVDKSKKNVCTEGVATRPPSDRRPTPPATSPPVPRSPAPTPPPASPKPRARARAPQRVPAQAVAGPPAERSAAAASTPPPPVRTLSLRAQEALQALDRQASGGRGVFPSQEDAYKARSGRTSQTAHSTSGQEVGLSGPQEGMARPAPAPASPPASVQDEEMESAPSRHASMELDRRGEAASSPPAPPVAGPSPSLGDGAPPSAGDSHRRSGSFVRDTEELVTAFEEMLSSGKMPNKIEHVLAQGGVGGRNAAQRPSAASPREGGDRGAGRPQVAEAMPGAEGGSGEGDGGEDGAISEGEPEIPAEERQPPATVALPGDTPADPKMLMSSGQQHPSSGVSKRPPPLERFSTAEGHHEEAQPDDGGSLLATRSSGLWSSLGGILRWSMGGSSPSATADPSRLGSSS